MDYRSYEKCRRLTDEEASRIYGGDFIVPVGPDSNDLPDAKFILIPDGPPNYSQDEINQVAYYNKYKDYYSNELLTYARLYPNTLELVMNTPGVGTYSNIAIIPDVISNVQHFWFALNQLDAPRIETVSFANGVASIHYDDLDYTWKSDVTATLTDLGDGRTQAVISLTMHGVNG
jgi:hypothetical protein